MNHRNVIAVFVCLLALSLVGSEVALGQSLTGKLTGRVTYDGEPLPGVSITATSPAMQGEASALTSDTGYFKLPFLPPGEYVVTFALDGFKQAESTVNINATQDAVLSVAMRAMEFAGEVAVVAMADTVTSGIVGASTIEGEMLELLAVSRDMTSAVALSAGVTGSGGYFRISGGETWENLYSMNGMVLNENIYGTPLPLYIEDAIQETTVMTSGVSAEYGRFSGGFVNMITKSGGNEFSGSVRASLTNDKWRGMTPLTAERVDELNSVYELTFGGPVWGDHLWFFLAGRSAAADWSMQTYYLNLPYAYSNDEKRYEAKLTFSPTTDHRITASYIKTEDDYTNNAGWWPMDLESLDPHAAWPLEGLAVNYSGVLSSSFLIEAQYSRSGQTFEGWGGDDSDLGRGTVVLDYVTGGNFNSPPWCGQCEDRERANQDIQAKAFWFVDTSSAGAHDIVFGVDLYDDQVQENFHNSGSGYSLGTYWPQDIRIDAGEIWGIFEPWYTYIIDGRVLEPSQRSSLKTNSIYANDTLRVGRRLTLNLGLRYDEHDGENQAGLKVIADSMLSPRLGASWDVAGDGSWIVNASFGRYVTSPNIWVADTGSAAGQSLWNWYTYLGPAVYASDLGSNPAAVEQVMNWFFDNPSDPTWLWVPGLTPKIGDNLRSPYGDELTIGLAKRLGNRGTFRMDFVHREYDDFYTAFLTPGQTGSHPDVGTFDLAIYENEGDLLERVYDGLMTRFDYRIGDRWVFGGSWTWSDNRGNYSMGTLPGASNVRSYQEYKDPAWNSPRGPLYLDQRNKVRAWGIWYPVSSPRHNLSAGILPAAQ